MEQNGTDADTEETLRAALNADIDDAITFIDTEIGPARALATKFYRGDLFGDEEQGRSQVVMPIVRDTARATLPFLVRMFMGTDRVVEFDPGAVGKEDFAEQATETVNYVLLRQNDGFRVLWAAFKDALVRKTGWVKWWWDDSIEVTSRKFSGVTEEQLQLSNSSLQQYEQLEVVDKTQVGEQPGQVIGVDANGSPVAGPPQPIFTYTIRIVCRKPRNKVSVAAVPPEEILFNRDATDEHGARLICHRTSKTRSQLVAMGIDEEVLDGLQFDDFSLETNPERIERHGSNIVGQSTAMTEDQARITFYDAYYQHDFDGDGISELRQVWLLGSGREMVRNEHTDEVPLALFCPDPEPHLVIGLSQADNVMDLQVLASHIWRDSLDSLKASIFPRMAYVEGQANVDDVLNTEIGAAIRMRSPNAVMPFEVPFVGEKAYPMLDRLEGVREQRTGVSRAAIGLDPSALQSTNQLAVTAAVTGAQAQVELIARIFAETGMKKLFRGILRLLTRHQDQRMEFRLSGRAFNVNPADWNPDMDVIVNTALGTGMPELKMQVLQATAAAQTLALDKLGIDNPMCSLQELYNTQKRLLQVAGFADVNRFWRDPTKAMEEGKTVQDPGETPEQTIATAQIEIEKSKADRESLEVILKDDLERDKLEVDAYLRAMEIRARYGMSVDTAAIKGILDNQRAHIQARNKKAATEA